MKTDTAGIFGPEFASSLLESMASGVFTLDKEGIITSWNPAMQRITGYSPEEAIGQKCILLKFNHCFGVACPTSPKQCGIYKHGKVEGKECYLQHKKGHDVPVIKSARIVTSSKGEVKGIVETITDLRELHKARLEAEEKVRS